MSWLGQVEIEKFPRFPRFIFFYYFFFLVLVIFFYSPFLATHLHVSQQKVTHKKTVSPLAVGPFIEFITNSHYHEQRQRADTVWIDISKLLPSYSWIRHTVGIEASRLHVIRSITLLLYAGMDLNTVSCHHKAEGGPLGLTTAFNGRCATLSLFSIEESRSNSDTPLLWRSDQPDAETALTTDRNPRPPGWNLKAHSPQANGRRPTT